MTLLKPDRKRLLDTTFPESPLNSIELLINVHVFECALH